MLTNATTKHHKAANVATGSHMSGPAMRPQYAKAVLSVDDGRDREGVGGMCVFQGGLGKEPGGRGGRDVPINNGACWILSFPFKTSIFLCSSLKSTTKIGNVCPRQPIGNQAVYCV